MSRFVHTGIIVSAIGVAAATCAPGYAPGAWVLVLAGLIVAAVAGVYAWHERGDVRAASAADRAARQIERVTARAAARVDAIAARARRAESLRAVVAGVVGAPATTAAANVHELDGAAIVDASSGVVIDDGDDAPGVRFVLVDDAGDDVAADDAGEDAAPRGDFPCCEHGEHDTTTGAGA